MKVKCINNYDIPDDECLTLGGIYEVQDQSTLDGNHYRIKEDWGKVYYYEQSRFEVVEQSLEEKLKAAKQLVVSLEEQIEANKPKFKVGQKYKTNNSDTVWMIVDFEGKYGFVCIECSYDLGLSYSGKLHDKIEDIFIGHLKYFTLIK